MSKIQKLVDKIQSNPRDLTWNELVKILAHFGYTELNTGKTGGSRRGFVDDQKNIIRLHKPHPENIVKHYQIKEVVTHLKERGKLKDE